ncbi:uncharacterized protein [Euphorbia lathyris]
MINKLSGSYEGNSSNFPPQTIGEYKNPPADALHLLADAGTLVEKASEKCVLIHEEPNIVNHNGNGKKCETSSSRGNELIVYRRRVGKKSVGKRDDKLTTYAEALLNLSPIITEQTCGAMQNDLNSSMPHTTKESNTKPVEQGIKSLLQALNTTDASQSLLSILR